MIARFVAWLRHIPANFFRMDGYWGGITMWDRNKLRKKP